MSKEGRKRVKGIPVYWDELKSKRTLTLTDTAWECLGQKAERIGVSKSELIEALSRGVIPALTLEDLEVLGKRLRKSLPKSS
ncbi:hypothetical protein H6S82_01115 [Planktothrix sp. FACHB-1355]|uniref:Ribbon-helix-helix domain-containing protein n=1 Tax=Aerosakkonema funiforme FACHB-1375 TaxID=2949571 RepID=A0A926ZL85_9CYAN|nr:MULTISPECIES: hypothetical protein [Oscillatoriales]MBD2184821.1 hypothetical protein [Aerosakkonema funiforme FACHB-1375]MBD3557469.1 hypothetical protein [Planktothrix sp. FACHB-1355]